MDPLRVLVIDDEPLIHSAIASVLRGRAEMRFAETAEEALQQCGAGIEGGEFDLVLLDLWMPGVPDGIDFYRRLQELGARMPRVIFMTGDATAAGVVRERLRTPCIDKPFDRKSVLQAVDYAVSLRPSHPSATYRRS